MALSRVTRSALVALGASAASAAEQGVQVITDANQAPQAPSTLPPYNCHAEYDIWETAWTPDWKAWCCKNEQLGCPSTTTTTATSTTATSSTATSTTRTATTSTTLETCDAVCEYRGAKAACGDRVVWSATYETANETDACEAAHVLVVSQCSKCGGCSPKAAGCHNPSKEHAHAEKERVPAEHVEQEHSRGEQESRKNVEEEHAHAEKEHTHDEQERVPAEHVEQEHSRGEQQSRKNAEEEHAHAEKEHAHAEHEHAHAEQEHEHGGEKKSMTFRQKFEEPAALSGQGEPRSGLGFFARCSLAGMAAGVPLAVVLRRSLRAASARPEAREPIYEQTLVRGEDEEQGHE